MNTAFSAQQRTFEARMPPEEPDIEREVEIFESILVKATAGLRAINRTHPRRSEAEGLAEEIRALCMQYPTGDTP